jgi:hypothetical protein
MKAETLEGVVISEGYEGYSMGIYKQAEKAFYGVSNSLGLAIGPIKTAERAKKAICDLIKANQIYIKNCKENLLVDGKNEKVPFSERYPFFESSLECSRIVWKYDARVFEISDVIKNRDCNTKRVKKF